MSRRQFSHPFQVTPSHGHMYINLYDNLSEVSSGKSQLTDSVVRTCVNCDLRSECFSGLAVSICDGTVQKFICARVRSYTYVCRTEDINRRLKERDAITIVNKIILIDTRDDKTVLVRH